MEQLEQGNDVLLEIEMQGALKIKEKFPEVSLIFITPPSVEELKNRLINRGTETMEVIEKRVKRAAQECVYMQEYNYIVENDSLEVCIEQIHALLQSIHFENKNQKNLIENIRKDFDPIQVKSAIIKLTCEIAQKMICKKKDNHIRKGIKICYIHRIVI